MFFFPDYPIVERELPIVYQKLIVIQNIISLSNSILLFIPVHIKALLSLKVRTQKPGYHVYQIQTEISSVTQSTKIKKLIFGPDQLKQ